MLSEKLAFEKLKDLGQTKLVSHWLSLSFEKQQHLLKQIYELDAPQFYKQREVLVQNVQMPKQLEPFKKSFVIGNQDDQKLGNELINKGACACLILAGGQGSRLRFDGPKGCFPVSLIQKKSLFQLVAEKVKAAGALAERPLDIAILTSPLNHEETCLFFKKNHFFGLDPNQVQFFCQKLLPLLDFDGNLFLEAEDLIAQGPNGNGGMFKLLVESDIWESWQKKKIEWVNVMPIDNALALPFDYELFGFAQHHKCEIAVKAVFRKSAAEKVGVLAQTANKLCIVEYTELPEEEKEAKNTQQEFKYSIANLGLFCFSMPFILAASSINLPLHKAKKSVKMLDEEGKICFPVQPNAWKFEEFIFDAFFLAKSAEALIYPRDLCFAPLKNLTGEDSIEKVQAALLANDHKIFGEISGIMPPKDAVFELAPEFYYPTRALKSHWKGKTLPTGISYIEGSG